MSIQSDRIITSREPSQDSTLVTQHDEEFLEGELVAKPNFHTRLPNPSIINKKFKYDQEK